jgi:hypothetical protein
MRWIAVLAAVLSLAGCAGGGTIDPKDETVSLVYGYFDMKDAPQKVDWVRLRKYDAAAKEAEGYNMAATDGMFFHVGIEPGSYQVEKFGYGGGFLSNPIEWSFGGRGRNGTAIRITNPGVYFVGAHRYIKHPGKGFFEADRFDMEPAKAPSEKEVLQRVVKRLETDPELKGYARQLQLAKKRLGEL